MSFLRVDAVLFDFDGTLTIPGALDFKKVRMGMGIGETGPILEHIRSLSDPEERSKAENHLHAFEMDAAALSLPQPGAEDMVRQLRSRGISLGILTRNTRSAVERSFANFTKISMDDFGIILTRDDPTAHKPEPDGIHQAARKLGVPLDRIALVGDYLYDVQAGRKAGVFTILLSADEPEWMAEALPDYHVRDFRELLGLLNEFLPLSAGKLAAEQFKNLLSFILTRTGQQKSDLIMGPGIGEDAAVINLTRKELLVVKSDPITFSTDRAGFYAPVINGNDIFCSGALPAYFFATLIFPLGITYREILSVFTDLLESLASIDVVLAGGHTEISDAVNRTIISGTMTGFVRSGQLLRKDGMREGNKILFTKHPGVEGTAILARMFKDFLSSHGLSAEELNAAESSEDQISIRKEARIAAASGKATAMHDVTEGGLATALRELAVSGGHDISVAMEKIPVNLLTEKICKICGINSLGLIGSGSLLICLRAESSREMIAALQSAGIKTTEIGKVLGEGSEVRASRNGEDVPFPVFEADELARFVHARGDGKVI